MKRVTFLFSIVTVLFWLTGAILVCPVRASQPSAQANLILLSYTVSYSDTHTPPLITLKIQGVPKGGLDLIVSPMTSFDMNRREDAFTWIVDEVQAATPEGEALSIEKRGITSPYFSLVPINPRYRLYHLDAQGHDEVLVHYRARVPIVVGYLETLLLRPARHEQIEQAEIHFDLPQGWKVATVVPSLKGEDPTTFDLQRLNTMYGDNVDPALNYVPMAFAVGPQKDIVEVQTDCGRLIFSYPYDYPLPFGDRERDLGRRMFEFMCHAVGPLEPYRTFIANNNWQESWMPKSYQPGLYAHFWQHNRTMDWSTGVPTFVFSPWQLETARVGNTVIDVPDVTYYHLPHSLSRAWFKGSTYFVLRWGRSDTIARGGFSGYLQERMLYCAFGPLKVYKRWQETYEYYKENYAGTSKDKPPMSAGDHFIEYFKSELWAFYANQKILEATNGQHDLTDAIRWLYEKFGGTGQAYDYPDIREAINITANANLGYLFDEYWYTTKPLPLDEYFADDDQDGVPNGLEREYGLRDDQPDTDGDGILDGDELQSVFDSDPYACMPQKRAAIAYSLSSNSSDRPSAMPLAISNGSETFPATTSASSLAAMDIPTCGLAEPDRAYLTPHIISIGVPTEVTLHVLDQSWVAGKTVRVGVETWSKEFVGKMLSGVARHIVVKAQPDGSALEVGYVGITKQNGEWRGTFVLTLPKPENVKRIALRPYEESSDEIELCLSLSSSTPTPTTTPTPTFTTTPTPILTHLPSVAPFSTPSPIALRSLPATPVSEAVRSSGSRVLAAAIASLILGVVLGVLLKSWLGK